MGESKHPCPQCARPVGGVHEVECPRSRSSQRTLQEHGKYIRRRVLERVKHELPR